MDGRLYIVTEGNTGYERWSKEHYENFTVGSWLLPKRLRHPVRILYAYCRYVDDLGDEAPGDRIQLLDAFERDVLRCYSGTPQHALLRELQPIIQQFDLPPEPFLKLIEANRMDQRVTRYESYTDLLVYCDHSANPVGRLFLGLLGYADTERQELADATCTALQLVNFWQDVAEDYAKGRIYLPQEDMRRFDVTEASIAAGDATANFRKLLAFESDRAHQLFIKGLPLGNMVDGLAKVDIRLFSYGGLAVLDGLRACNYNVFDQRPIVSKWRKLKLFGRAVLWLRTPALPNHARGESQ